MTVGRIVGLVVLVVLLVAVISEPVSSAATVRSGGRALGSVGTSLGEFVSTLTNDWRTGSADRVSPSTVESVSYTVRPGDTLSSIASAHHVRVSTLAGDNDIADTDLIHPGQELSIR